MIVVLSLNTAIDRLMLVPGFAGGQVYRAERSVAVAGGKALNVARVLRRLGHPVRVVGMLGGMPESFVRTWCDREGIEGHWVRIEMDSRTCVIVVDPQSAHQTVLNEPGPRLNSSDMRRIDAAIEQTTQEGDTLCISGSAPPGVAASFYADLIVRMRERGIRVLVDTAGAALRLALDALPWAAAPNASECATALSHAEDPPTLIAALSERVEHAILTIGSEGLLYAHGDRIWRVRPPAIQTVNAVGSGDACVAGFLAGIIRGLPPLDAIQLGVACGAANAARFEPGIESVAEVERLSSLVRIDPFDPSRPAR
ncbi:MAG TPA: hexose kinase [Chloroflexota bacterium]